MGKKIIRRVLMMSCVVLLKSHLRIARSIALLVSGRGRVDGLGDAL